MVTARAAFVFVKGHSVKYNDVCRGGTKVPPSIDPIGGTKVPPSVDPIRGTKVPALQGVSRRRRL
jgi:hypothetical protein